MLVKHINLPAFPEHTVSAILYSDVSNAAHILERLKSADQSYNYCFLACDRICSLEQVLFATMRALKDQRDGIMRTHTLYSEIVYSMSPNQNITEALKQFGVAASSTAILCLALNGDIDTSLVHGTIEDVTNANLRRHCQLDSVKKVYKLDKTLVDYDEVSIQVIAAIALRGNL